jgi:putative membrane-bound dehydrogenase-like protein
MARPCVLCLVALLTLGPTAALRADEAGIRVPPGFEVSLYADDELAHDIFSMTIDAQGRVVVAGAGYVKTLHDTDGDGRADRATLFSSVPASGAHGMYFDGPDLICTGDDSVMRLRDTDGDGAADNEPQVWTALRHPEHGANGLVRGPDGCYYLVCGNDAGISTKLITAPHSPVTQPRSGGIVRFSATGQPLDVYAHGFRNPYDIDFDAAGHLFTVDSDGERDHHLPWYAPTRLFDVAQGMEHGWLLAGWARGWNRPASFLDNVERLVEIGRGSPTGVTAYRHRAFPAHYRGGVFAACWTFGRVYYFPLEAAGSTLASKLEVFMQTEGDLGFAPCDLAVGPKGDLFVAIGGRRTRGSVFRVQYHPEIEIPPAASPLASVLEADQPLASWSRARWIPAAQQLGKGAFEAAVDNTELTTAARVRAIEVLVELFEGLEPARATAWATTKSPEVRARVAWALGRGSDSPDARQILARLTADADPRVQRASWEALCTLGPIDPEITDQPDWTVGLSTTDRRVRAAAIAAARGPGQASYRDFLSKVRIPSDAIPLRLAQLWVDQPATVDTQLDARLDSQRVAICLKALAATGDDRRTQLEIVRLLQLALGDVRTAPDQAEVYSGYSANAAAPLDEPLRSSIVKAVAPRFPTADAELNRELARLLGMLHALDPRLLAELARKWTVDSPLEDDFHYLIVASLVEGPRTAEVTRATAGCLLRLHAKLDRFGAFASRNWPFRAGEVFEELSRRDPALCEAILANEEFGHVEHTLFVERLPEKLKRSATRLLWTRAAKRGQEPTAELIALVGHLPEEEALSLLRAQWEEGELRDAVAMALARYPQPQDRARYIESLSSPQPAVVTKAARALVSLGLNCSTPEMAAALRALKQSCAVAKNTEPRESLLRLLNFWTEENSDVDLDPDPARAYVGWFELFEQYYPAEAAKLNASSGANAETWKKRLAAIDWAAGDTARGRGVYERRACHRCHQVSGHLGPELKGAISRLSREDLFTAIIDPNLEVSPAFRTTLVATNSGQVYHGLIVYESPEGTLLQTGPDTTVRVTNVEQSSVRPSSLSLMPTGLLDTLSDQDLSDLYAHLRTLGQSEHAATTR